MAQGSRLLELVAVMDRLRRECPWDQQQTHESLVRYLIEETYETVDAIESGDPAHLREELGDVLLQVVFHARIAEEDPAQPFDVDDVAAGIVDKLVRRHPHVFAHVEVQGASDVQANWEAIKAAETPRRSVTDGVPLGLPALALADKVIARSQSRSGGRQAAAGRSAGTSVPEQPTYTAETLGEVLFALVAAARACGIDAEQALRTRVRTELDALDRPDATPGDAAAG